jgi:hypothetical protein
VRFVLVLAASAIFVAACGKRSYVAPAPSSAPVLPATFTAGPALAGDRGVPQENDDRERPAIKPLATTCNGVSLVLVSVTTSEGGVDAVLELRNAGAESVPLMMPGDGSTSGRRNPTVTFELTPSHVAPRMGCGNMNDMSAADFVTLGPRRYVRVGWTDAPTPSETGHYTLRAIYRNDPKSPLLGHDAESANELVVRARKTVPCTLVSNTVAFVWTQPPVSTKL